MLYFVKYDKYCNLKRDTYNIVNPYFINKIIV